MFEPGTQIRYEHLNYKTDTNEQYVTICSYLGRIEIIDIYFALLSDGRINKAYIRLDFDKRIYLDD